MEKSNCEQQSQFIDGRITAIRWMQWDEGNDARPETFASSGGIGNGELKLWQLPSCSNDGDAMVCRQLLNLDAECNDLRLLPDRQLVTCLDNGDVFFVDGDEWRVRHSWKKVHGNCAAVCLAVHDREIISGGEDGSLIRLHGQEKMTDISNGRQLAGVRCVAYCSRSLLVSGHVTGQLLLWDLRQGTSPVHSLSTTNGIDAVTAIGVHPAQNDLIGFGSESGSVTFCDIRRGDQSLSSGLSVSSGPIWQLCFHPIYANNCYSASEDGSLLHWDASRLNSDRSSDGGHLVAWLNAVKDRVPLSYLITPTSAAAVNCFDLTGNWAVLASGNSMITVLDNILP